MAYSKLAKKKLLELADLINEDITSGRAIVYHRTGKYGSPIAGIAADGFRVGTGAAYGVGVYTTYDLESQLSGNMGGYGNIIIESKIKTLNKFLIFDYDVAKRIYGNNFTLENQLRLILGKEWNRFKNNTKLNDILEKISVVKYTSEVAMSVVTNFPEIVLKLRGIIFTGSNDGKVCVSYDRTNIEPLRYTLDEGRTWKNILDKNIYKRIKKQHTEDDTEYQHLINRLDVGEVLSDEEIKNLASHKKISDELLMKLPIDVLIKIASITHREEELANSIVNTKRNDILNLLKQFNNNYTGHYISGSFSRDKNFTLESILKLLSNAKKSEEIIYTAFEELQVLDYLPINLMDINFEVSFINKLILKFIDKISSNVWKYLYEKTNDKNELIDYFLKIEGKKFIETGQNSQITEFFIKDAENKNLILEKIFFSIDKMINNNALFILLKYCKTEDQIKKISKFFDTLKREFIIRLFQELFNDITYYGMDQIDFLIKMIIKYKNNLDSPEIEPLLKFTKNIEETIKLIGQDKINNLPKEIIRNLIIFRGYEMLKFLGYDKINFLETFELSNLLKRSNPNEKELIFDLILKFDKDKLKGGFLLNILQSLQNKEIIIEKLDIEILNKLDFNTLFQVAQYEKKNDNIKFLLLEKLNDFGMEKRSDVYRVIIENTSDINKIYNKLKELNLLDKLDSYSLLLLINKFENKDKIIDDIIENVSDSLPMDYIILFFKLYSDIGILTNKIPKNIIENLDSTTIYQILRQKENNDEKINIFLNNIKNLNELIVYYFIFFHSNLDYIFKVLGQENINKLVPDHIEELFYVKKDINKLTNLLGKENINKLKPENVYNLLSRSFQYSDSSLDKLIEAIGLNNIYKLNKEQVFRLIEQFHPENKKEIPYSKYYTLINVLGEKINQGLDDYYISKLLKIDLNNKNNFFRDIIFKYRKNFLNSQNVFSLLLNKINREETLEMLGSENIKKLSDQQIKSLNTDYFINQNEIIDILLKYKIDDLTGSNVVFILQNSKDIYDSANKIGKQNIDKLSANNIFNLLFYAKDPNQITNLLGENNIKKLTEKELIDLLTNTSESKRKILSNIILNNLKENLTPNIISYIISYSDDIDETIDRILELKKNKLDLNLIRILISRSSNSNKDNLIKKILIIKGQSLTQEDIIEFIAYSNNIEEISKLIGKDKIDNLDSKNVTKLLTYSIFKEDVNKIINMLGTKIIDKIETSQIYEIIDSWLNIIQDENEHFLKRAVQFLNIFGKEKINKLSDANIIQLLSSQIISKNKYGNKYGVQNLKKLLSNFIPKQRLNNIIQQSKLETDLIQEKNNILNLRKKIKNILREESFKIYDLDYNEQSNIYDTFKQSYEKSVGTSWEKDKFFSRSSNWLFFGDKEGFVAVRPQNSGFYKLVGVAGKLKSIIKGVEELQATGNPIWGMVTEDIKKMALKKGFKTPPAFLIKFLLKMIPKNVFGDTDFIINSDGSITLNYSDVGPSRKYFIANDAYFRKLKTDSWSQISDKLTTVPSIVQTGIKKFLAESEMINEQNNIRKFVKQIIKDIY